MATIDQLKAKLAALKQKRLDLTPSVEAAIAAAQKKLNEADAAIATARSQPGRISLKTLADAKKAADANPTNTVLQERYKTLLEEVNAQRAAFRPFIDARDEAVKALRDARSPLIDVGEEIADVEIEIAKIDPSQANPDAVEFLKENGGLPITPESDPALKKQTPADVPSESTISTPPAVGQEPFNEFEGVDEAVAEQKRIATNTSGLPVLAEDGSVAQGILQNPETGERYYTEAPFAEGSSKSIDARKKDAQAQGTIQDTTQFKARQDWRVRLSLSPGAKYLYNATEESKRGILSPLAATDGVIFPYTPQVTVNYNAKYEATPVTHSNYLIQQYNSSSVDNIQIVGVFTAQDTREANYLLAVIHFFRSVTKMFYGQDQAVKPGTPPPLCYLFGFGAFQFDAHPLAITNFTYSLPDDVDYIKANISYGNPGVNRQGNQTPNNTNNSVLNRLANRIMPGGLKPPAKFVNTSTGTFTGEPTYVPTKITLTINAVPVISRNQISNEFSLEKYATGELLRGTKRSGGGIW